MTIDVSKADEVTILKVKGRLTLDRVGKQPFPGYNPDSGAIQLKERLKEFLEAGVNEVHVDLADVTSIDSNGVGTLLSGRTDFSIRGRQFRLINPSSRVVDYLHMTNLHQSFGIK